jgi:hypothetical protein
VFNVHSLSIKYISFQIQPELIYSLEVISWFPPLTHHEIAFKPLSPPISPEIQSQSLLTISFLKDPSTDRNANTNWSIQNLIASSSTHGKQSINPKKYVVLSSSGLVTSAAAICA